MGQNQSQNKKTKPKKPQTKFQKNDLKIELKEEPVGEIEVLEEIVTYNRQSVNTDENLTAFTDDIDNFSNEEILILSNDTSEMITQENTEIIVPDNCCLDQTAPEDCEHKKEIKTLRKKMISILKDHSYTNVDKNGKKIEGNLNDNPIQSIDPDMEEATEVEHLEEEFQENSNLEELSENEFVEYLDDPDTLSPNTEEIIQPNSNSNFTSQSNSPKKFTQLKNMDVEDQIVTNEIKLEILNGEDLKEEVDKLRKEVIILKKLLIEKERIIESQEKYILLLEKR